MTAQDRDTGVITVLMTRFESYRLPRALSLKEKVDGGEVLDSSDIAFLQRVFEDADHVKHLADRHPDYQNLCARVAHLYHQITERALENEQRHQSH